MPYKEKLKQLSKNPRKKVTYKVTNWSEYNQSLKKRGKLTLYFPPGDLKSQFINEETYIPGVSGQQVTYTPSYVELMYTFYRLFGWGLRQMTGYFEDLWENSSLDIEVPSFGHLSDQFSVLPVKVKHFCDKIAKRLSRGESIDLILDSTGLRFSNASHWYEKKYGKARKNTPWRKLHLSMDSDMEMYGVEVTECDDSDLEIMDDLVENVEALIAKIIADGAYYSIEGVEALYKKGITPAIPPPSHSVVHNLPTTTWHDKIVQYIKDKGSIYAFHKKYGYGKRALVESQISRIKRCVGDSFKTQKPESQKREGIIIANIINRWNAFGKCLCVKDA
jgi:hypothetical protein